LARRIILVAIVAVLVTVSWLRLEDLSVSWRDWLPMLLLALLPIASVALGRRWYVTGLVLAGATLLALSQAVSIPLSEARPRDPQRDFFGPALGGVRRGFLDFYDAQLPFDRIDYPMMHALVLLAIFGFTALVGMLVMARRPIGASLALVAAIGWPATLFPADYPLRAGILALVGVLAVLFLLRRDEPLRGVAQAVGLGVLLVVLAGVASGSDAVAKTAFLPWQTWDPYDRPTPPVSVDYVWNANYNGITFPEKPTTVLKVKVSGSKRSLYWRATTLDDYTGEAWDEDLHLSDPEPREEIDAVGRNPLLPRAAADEDNWVRQDFTIGALRDTHLLGSAQPVRWRPGTEAPVADDAGDIVVLPDTLRRDQRYTVWSYVPRPNPSQLEAFQGTYDDRAARYLQVVYSPVPAWDAPSRDTQMAVFFGAEHADEFEITALRPLYEEARRVTSAADTPYEAAVLLETWFRQAGGFTYDEQPPAPFGGTPPLVDFVLSTKRGYCQHYAGAMALMLRLLGVPSRVAVGFTSGTYNADNNEWTVKDTNAHAWVEVWFPRYGWIPFDPTPGRGQLGASYSPYAGGFNSGDAADIGLDTTLEGISPALAERIRSQAGRPGLESASGLSNPASEGGAVATVRDRGPSLFVLLLLVLAGAYAVILGIKTIRRSLRFATRDPRALASACRQDVVGYLADQGVDVPQSATLEDIGETLERYYAVNAQPFVRSLTQARFGPPAVASAALGAARQQLRDVRRALRQNLGFGSRLRGSASLRSLGL
jgi:transglutaminase-like putative cysteine protease